MSFKIWGKEGLLSKEQLQEKLVQLGVNDTFSLIDTLRRKGVASVGHTKIFLLK